MQNTKSIELLRMIVPQNKIINDNAGTHYRVHMGKIKYLATVASDLLEFGGSFETFPEQSNIEVLKNRVKSLGSTIGLIQEVWRFNNRRFDPQNLSKTFKAPLDIIVSKGIIPDDNYNFIRYVKITGGGLRIMNIKGEDQRVAECENSQLVIPVSQEEWVREYGDLTNTLIRIIATDQK